MGWLDKLENGGEFSGTTNKGFKYNGAWGGPAQNGKTVVESTRVKKPSVNSKELKNIISDMHQVENEGEIIIPRAEANKLEKFLPDDKTKKFFKRAEKALLPSQFNNLVRIQMENGNPSINEGGNKGLPFSNKRNYNPLTNEINIPSSQYLQEGDPNIDNYLDEVSHAGQPLSEVIPKFVTNDIPSWLKYKVTKNTKDSPYKQKGSVEYNTHSIIEPKIRKQFESNDSTFSNMYNSKFEDGGNIAGSVGFSYARTEAPSNGKYAKKTLPSAQDGLALYDPEKNPEWKGLDERTASIRLKNATKSNSERAMKTNQEVLDNIAAFNTSKKNYIDQQSSLVDQYALNENSIQNLSEIAKKKYDFDLSQEDFVKMSPKQMVTKVMIDKANAAIASGKGYPLSQDPKNEMTCINGVCTAASEAGVDFSALAGKLGVVKDARGKDIPQYNVTWAKDDNYRRAGFERIPEGETPQPGDFAQYEEKRDDSHMDVEHMELVKKVLPTGYESFNNYNQTNNPVPGSGNSVRTFEGNSKKTKEFPDTYYFRLKDEVAENIVRNDPQYKNVISAYNKFKESDDYKTYAEKKAFLESNKERYQKAKEYLEKNRPKDVTSLKSGGVIKDDDGYWNPDNWGKTVEINSNNITMKGVNQPLIGVSDKGETKYMEPGKDYKFKGKKVTEYPVMQSGGKLYDDDVQQFHYDYINSPKYKERLIRSGYEDVPEEIKQRSGNIEDVDINYERPSKFKKFITQTYPHFGSHYDPEKNAVNLDHKTDVYDTSVLYNGFAKPYQREIEAHELAHSQINKEDAKNLDDTRLNFYDKYHLITKLKEPTGDRAELHDRKSGELKADLDAYRYMLNKSGKYNSGKQDFTKDHLKKSKKTFVKDRLQKNYSDEDIIWLMNNVADVSKRNKKTAKNGGELTKLDQNTNFTNYNKPQPGGWLDNL